MFKAYLIKYLLFLLPGGLFISLNYAFLLRTGELLTLRQIVERQTEDFCLYGTALHDDTFHFKLDGYASKKPDVALIGSSRVMQMREGFFRSSFYNLGGAMNSIGEGAHLVDLMLKLHKPKLLLIGADFWWFNDKFSKVNARQSPLPPQQRMRIGFLLKPASLLREGKITAGKYVNILTGRSAPSHGSVCTIGISAAITHDGFGPDGSYYYSRLLGGKMQEDSDEKFSHTIERIKTAGSRFERGDHANAEHAARFLESIRSVKEQGIQVAVFFPPLAPAVNRALDRYRDQYGYFAELRTILRDAGVDFFDFEDAPSLISNDCEFVDGFHGGDVTNARMILAMARKDAGIRSFVDIPSLEATIQRNRGRASVLDARVMNEKEEDFLKIGCSK